MSADASLDLQLAMVTRLKADAELTALVAGRVYDRAPDNAAFPMVTMGPTLVSAWDGSDMRGAQTFLQVDTWSRAYGRVEAQKIMRAIWNALHLQELVLGAGAFVMCRLDNQQTMVDADGVTIHGVQRFEFLTHE